MGLSHMVLHALCPLLIALVFFRERWLKAYALMLLGMLIDLDHLLATPIYDPGRCSIGFHPLHRAVPAVLYAALLFHRKTRLLGLGLCLHLALDAFDCGWMRGLYWQAWWRGG